MRIAGRESWPCGQSGGTSRRGYHAHASPTRAASATPAGRMRRAARVSNTPFKVFPESRVMKHETRIKDFTAVLVAGGAKGPPNQKPQPGSLCLPTSHCLSALVYAAWRGNLVVQSLLAYQELLGGGGPEPVPAHRQSFWVGLTTSAVRYSSRRPTRCYRCGERQINPC